MGIVEELFEKKNKRTQNYGSASTPVSSQDDQAQLPTTASTGNTGIVEQLFAKKNKTFVPSVGTTQAVVPSTVQPTIKNDALSVEAVQAQFDAAKKAEEDAWAAYNQYNNSTHWSTVDMDKMDALSADIMTAQKAREEAEQKLLTMKYGAEYAEKYGVGSGLQGVDKGVISIGKSIGATPGVIAQTGKAAYEEGTAENADPEVLAARQKEDAAQRAADSFVAMNSGSLDMPEKQEELKKLNEALDAATAERKAVEAKHAVKLDMTTKPMQNMLTASFLAEDATSNLSGVSKDVAGAALSVGQNLPFVAAGFIPAVGPALALGGMSAVAGAQDMAQQGAAGKSAGEAFRHGAAVAAIEAMTEKIPLDNLADMVKKGGKSFIVNLFKQAGIEAAEEGVSYTMNYILDKAEGAPDAKFDWEEFFRSVKQGGLSGMFFGLGGTAVGGQNSSTQATPSAIGRTEENPTTGIPAKNAVLGVNEGLFTGDQQAAQQTDRQVRLAAATTDTQRSGIMMDVDTEVIAQVERISNSVGKKVLFYREPVTTKGSKNGYYDKAAGTIWVNANGTNPVAQILSHEMTHSVEFTQGYQDLSSLVLTRIQQTDGDLEQRRQAIRDLYAKNDAELKTPGEVDAEVVADYVAEHLLTDEQSIMEMVQYNPSLGRRILDWLNNLLARMGFSGAQERAFVTQAISTYNKALNQSNAGFGMDPATLSQRMQGVYAEDKLTEQEYDEALDLVMQEESLAGRSMLDIWELGNGGRQYSFEETNGGNPYDGKNLSSDASVYSYDFLTSLPDMKVTKLPEVSAVRGEDGRVDSATVVELGIKNARSVGTERDGKVYVRNSYTGKPLLITTNSIRHGLNGNMNRLLTNARLGAVIGEVVRNAVPINALHNKAPGVSGTYAMADYATDSQGREFVAIITVEQYDGNVSGIEAYDVTHAVSGRQKNRSRRVDTKSQGFYPSANASEINISDLLDVVKMTHQSILSDDVLAHLGETRNPGGFYSGQVKYSISEPTEGQMVEELPMMEVQPLPDVDPVSTLPTKAAQHMKQAERRLAKEIAAKLSVPSYAKRSFLDNVVRDMSNEYLRTGTISQETIDNAFEQAYSEGVVTDREFYDEHKHIKNYLRSTKVNISDAIKSDIADFDSFRKSAMGTLNMVKGSGIGVDTAYMELTEMAPGLFPESITNPSDQLLRMYDVGRSIRVAERGLDEYYGPEAAEFKKWAKHDFEVAVNDTLAELRLVKRYADERVQQERDAQPVTLEEVKEAYPKLKDARRNCERVMAKNLLTEEDTRKVGQLLRGDIDESNLDPAKDNIGGIMAVYKAKQEYEQYARRIRKWNQERKAKLREEADSYLATANSWKDKKMGIQYSRETMERNIRDIVPDADTAHSVINRYFTPVHDSQAEATRTKNNYRDRVKKLDLSRKVAKGNEVSEAHAVQLLGEAEDNIRMLEQSRGRMKMRDGKTLSDWKGILDNLWAQNPDLNERKIRGAVEEFRKIYDELFTQMNTARVRNGYEPINYRNGYFPHFQPGDGDGILIQFGKAMGIDTAVTALPTTINGLTHTFKPGIQWFGNAQERLGFNTAYDAVEGFDKYIEGCADVIHQTDNIQALRALASQIRYRTSDDGIRKQVDAVRADTTLSEEDKNNRIEKIYESGKFTLSNFVVELEEYTNLLANKKSRADRNMEQALGRNSYNLVKALESRVAANMVAVNPASWLTNFIPLTQGNATLDRGMLLKGMWDTLKAYKIDDGIVGQSTFLTNRRGSDPIVKTWAQNASAALSKPMEYIDQFTADTLVRARYQQNLKRGMSEDAAMEDADSWAAGVMADRSKGSTPTLFNRTNPVTKVFTQFQLEVNNQLSYLFKDLPDEAKKKGGAAIVGMLIKFMLGAYLYDEIYEYFIGRRPALDPIGILNDTVGDLTGYELPNLVEAGVDLVQGEKPSFETEKVGTYEALSNAGTALVEELPFIGGVLGGGRVPISSALPDFTNLARAATDNTWDAKKRGATAIKELTNPATYLALPFGGGQVKKAVQGIQAVIEGGSYSVDAEGNDLLQYPVYSDTPWETAKSVAGATLFGKTSLPTGRDWIESGFKTLSAEYTQAYKNMRDAGIGERDAYEILTAMRAADKDADKLGVVAQSGMPDDTLAELVGLVMDTKLKTDKGNDTEYAKLLDAMETALGASAAIQMKVDGLDLDKFLELEGAGVNAQGARDLTAKLDKLKDPTNLQRYRTVVDVGLSLNDQMDALSTMMSESEYGKLQVGYDYGVVPDVYVDFKETVPKYDADSNGNYKQAEIQAAIDAMGIDDVGMKAALWQLANKSWKPEKNPYSVSVGRKVYDAMHSEG